MLTSFADVSMEVLDSWSACLDRLPMIDELSKVVRKQLDRPLPWLGSTRGALSHVLHCEKAKTNDSMLQALASSIIKTPGPFERFDCLIIDV